MKLISNFSKVTGCKVNTQRQLFPYTVMDKWNLRLKKHNNIYISMPQNETAKHKSNKTRAGSL